jgi:hypothetical protein
MTSKARHAQERDSVKASRPDKLIATAQRNITLIRENVPVLALTGVAFGASFGHIAKLCGDFGPHGWVQFATAGCVDLLCIIGAEERQRDKRIGRPRQFGFISWPTVVLIAGILVTLAANVATSDKHFLGYCVAAWPAGALLLAVSVLERRASFGTPASTRTSRRQSRAASTEPAAAVSEPVPAASTAAPVQETAQDDAAAAERTPEVLLAEARAYRAELAATTGERVTKDRLRLRLGIGSAKALQILKTLNEEDAGEAEAVAQ